MHPPVPSRPLPRFKSMEEPLEEDTRSSLHGVDLLICLALIRYGRLEDGSGDKQCEGTLSGALDKG